MYHLTRRTVGLSKVPYYLLASQWSGLSVSVLGNKAKMKGSRLFGGRLESTVAISGSRLIKGWGSNNSTRWSNKDVVGWAVKQLHLVRKQQFHIPAGTEARLAAEARLQQMVPGCGTGLLLQAWARGQGWAGHRLPKWGKLSGSQPAKFKAPRQSSCPRLPVEAQPSPAWACQTGRVVLRRLSQLEPHRSAPTQAESRRQ